MEVGAAPLTAERIPSIAEPQHPTPLVGSDAPKEQTPMLPEPQAPRSPLDLSAGNTHADCLLMPQKCLSRYEKYCSSIKMFIFNKDLRYSQSSHTHLQAAHSGY